MAQDYGFALDWPTEFERLQVLESGLDAGTIRHLQQIGIAPGGCCLEVGAGAGSIALWLARAVGADGAVVATDVDTRHLRTLARPNITIVEHDLRRDVLPLKHFDLVHARAVVAHLPEKRTAMRRLVNALKPGGWLLLEDFDHHLLLHAEQADTPFLNPTRAAIRELMENYGYDPYFGRALAHEMKCLGLEAVASEGRVNQRPGGSSSAQAWSLVLERMETLLVDSRVMSRRTLNHALRALDDAAYLVMTPLMWAAWGRRPEETH